MLLVLFVWLYAAARRPGHNAILKRATKGQPTKTKKTDTDQTKLGGASGMLLELSVWLYAAARRQRISLSNEFPVLTHEPVPENNNLNKLICNF